MNLFNRLVKYMKKYFVIFFVLVTLFGCSPDPSEQEINISKKLIDEIEKFIDTNSQVPKNEQAWEIMKTLGLSPDERCRPCYQRKSDDLYILYFGASLGQSYVYASKSKSWGKRLRLTGASSRSLPLTGLTTNHQIER